MIQPLSKRKKEQERCSALVQKLLEERKRQEDNNRLILEWIRAEKDTWFNSSEFHDTIRDNTRSFFGHVANADSPIVACK